MNADEQLEFRQLKERVSALEAKAITVSAFPYHGGGDGRPSLLVTPQSQYREPTLEDAHDLYNLFLLEMDDGMLTDDALRTALKIKGFAKKVQP